MTEPLRWRTDESYWDGRDAEYAWAEGTRDLHWMAYKGLLALYDNEYVRATQISHEDRSQEATKALAQCLQDVLEPRECPVQNHNGISTPFCSQCGIAVKWTS